jgi:hypothetical protein
MRTIAVIAACLAVSVTVAGAQRGRTPSRGRSTAPARILRNIGCAADLGTGVKTHLPFCDVLIGKTPTDSVLMTVPAHTGTATLFFDLHNRFTIPALSVPPVLAFARHEAIVAVIRGNGELIGRAAAVHEFRSTADLFDQISGGGRPGGIKAVAPGPPDPVRVTIPRGVTSIGIVGVSLKVLTRAGEQTFDSPGRPVAIVSNVRLEIR